MTEKELVLAHWIEIRSWAEEEDYDEISISQDACEYCHKYYELDCVGCPVFLKTGEMGCTNTPWERVYEIWGNYKHDGEMDNEKFLDAIDEEIAFLMGL